MTRSSPHSPDARRAGEVLQPVDRHPGRTRCLVLPLTADLGLSRTLLQHLSMELPDMDFTLRSEPSAVDAIWICGYEPAHASLVRRLRHVHPHARIVVTRRGSLEGWAPDALGSGADCARPWPLPLAELGALLSAPEAPSVESLSASHAGERRGA